MSAPPESRQNAPQHDRAPGAPPATATPAVGPPGRTAEHAEQEDGKPSPIWDSFILPRLGLLLTAEAARLFGRGRTDFALLAGDAALGRLVPGWTVPEGTTYNATTITRGRLRAVLVRYPTLFPGWAGALDAIGRDRLPGLLVTKSSANLDDLPGWTIPRLDSGPLVDLTAISDRDAIDLLHYVCSFAPDATTDNIPTRQELAAAVAHDKTGLITGALTAFAQGRQNARRSA